MDSKVCTKCIHEVVCESAKACDGRVPGCKHFKEQKKGRWIHKGAWHIECSECQYILAHIGEAKNYCPNCGAKMDGGNEDANKY